MSETSRAILLGIGTLLLLSCSVTSMHAQVVRKKSAPVQSNPASSPSRAETQKLPTDQVTPSPGTDAGIIIVGGKGIKPIEATKPIVGMETRDAGPKITTNPYPLYIPKGQTQIQATINWDVGPGLWYCEIFMSVNGGEEVELGRGHDGAKPVTIKLGSNYDFKMVVYSGENGEDPRTVTTLNIKGQLQPATPPPLGSSTSGVVVRPGTRGDLTNYIAYIQDVVAAPNAGSVAITFWTSGGVTPTVEIGKVAPVQAGGRWSFPGGQPSVQGRALSSQGTGPLSKKVGTSANTFYKFDSTQANFPALEPGQVHWYVITVLNPAGQPPLYQTTGRFTTFWQNLKVVFESVHITDDSDDLSDGDIKLWFWVNYEHPTQKIYERSREPMKTGRTYDLNAVLHIPYAPNALIISASADDDDTGLITPFGIPGDPGPYTGAGSNGDYTWNVAKDEWDLTRFPTALGETYRQAFTLVSMHGGALRFKVSGYWEVVRLRK